jgi:hypothetical protein
LHQVLLLNDKWMRNMPLCQRLISANLDSNLNLLNHSSHEGKLIASSACVNISPSEQCHYVCSVCLLILGNSSSSSNSPSSPLMWVVLEEHLQLAKYVM